MAIIGAVFKFAITIGLFYFANGTAGVNPASAAKSLRASNGLVIDLGMPAGFEKEER
jgi:hypothetical protein